MVSTGAILSLGNMWQSLKTTLVVETREIPLVSGRQKYVRAAAQLHTEHRTDSTTKIVRPKM